MLKRIVEEAEEVQVEVPHDEEVIEEVPVQEEPSTDVIQNAYAGLNNELINKAWDFIAAINSTIASIEAEPNGVENKDEVTSILSSVVDDVTVDVGMLLKVTNLIDGQTGDLMAEGDNKAEAIIGNSTEEVVEPEVTEE